MWVKWLRLRIKMNIIMKLTTLNAHISIFNSDPGFKQRLTGSSHDQKQRTSGKGAEELGGPKVITGGHTIFVTSS